MRSYFGLPRHAARTVAAVAGIVFCATALAALADPSVVLSTSERRILLASGVLAGAIVGWLAQHVTHQPMSRHALIPWGTVGGTLSVLVAASLTIDVPSHGAFVAMAVARALVGSVGLRLLTDAALGPLPNIPAWGVPLGTASRGASVKDSATVRGHATTPLQEIDSAGDAGFPRQKPAADLRLVTPEAADDDALRPRPAKRRR